MSVAIQKIELGNQMRLNSISIIEMMDKKQNSECSKERKALQKEINALNAKQEELGKKVNELRKQLKS